METCSHMQGKHKDAGTGVGGGGAVGLAAPSTLEPWGRCPPNFHRRSYSLFIIVTTSIKICLVDVSQQLQNTSFNCPELTDFRTRAIVSVLLGSFHQSSDSSVVPC